MSEGFAIGTDICNRRNMPRGQADCYKKKKKEAFSIIDKEPTISIKELAVNMGVSYGYAGNWFVSYRRHRRVNEKIR